MNYVQMYVKLVGYLCLGLQRFLIVVVLLKSYKGQGTPVLRCINCLPALTPPVH